MKNCLLALLSLFLFACSQHSTTPEISTWRGTLEIGEGRELPFNFEWTPDADTTMVIFNAEEQIVLVQTDIKTKGDSLRINMPVFESYFLVKTNGDSWTGVYKDPGRAGDYTIPFTAQKGKQSRFDAELMSNNPLPETWSIRFSPDTEDEYPAIAILREERDMRVTGTILTETGDYRYLEGIREGTKLKLSTFDGAHAFLFTGTIQGNEIVDGHFYSGNHYEEPWIGVADEEASLGSPDELTYLKTGYEGISFTFPGLRGNSISYPSDQYAGKVVIIQILGSWCPNCMDETRLFAEWYDQYHNDGLEIIGLAFERRENMADAVVAVQKMKRRLEADYDMLIASLTTSKTVAAEQLPMLNAVISYPTSIWIDRSGAIRKIHTGFNGPGTGEKYDEFVEEYEGLIQEMLAE